MKIKATVSFAGKISMHSGEVRDVPDSEILRDLIRCGYIEPVGDEAAAPKKEVPEKKGRARNDAKSAKRR